MNDSECQAKQPWYLRELIIAILSVSCIIGILGNGLVLWMTIFRMPRTVTTIWFFNLALADLTVLLCLPTFIYGVANGQWPFYELACKIYVAFLTLAFFSSIYILVLISVDRCILVLYPVWARNHRTVKQAICLSISIWLLGAIVCSPNLKYQVVEELHGCKYCYFEISSEKEQGQDWKPVFSSRQMAMNLAYFLLGFLVPLVIIGTCAHLICTKLQREGWVHFNRTKRLLVVLVGTFFVFWIPYNVTLLVQLGQVTLKSQSSYLQIRFLLCATSSLGCLSSCLNPFLYVFIGRDFQQKFFQSLTSALARAFGEEGFISHPVSEAKSLGNAGNLQKETRSLPSKCVL